MIYNTIHHEIRNKAGLSLLDYCLLESIFKLSTSGKSTYKGWCNASKSSFKYLASERTIINRFNHLEQKGWLEFRSNRMLKKTTKKYYDEIYLFVKGVKTLHGEKDSRVKELHPKGEEIASLEVKDVLEGGEKIAPNNKSYNYTDNLKDNLIQEKEEIRIEDQINKDQQSSKTKKVALKKVSGAHEFPDITSERKYEVSDKRIDKTLPFQSDTAFASLSVLDFEEIKQYLWDCQRIEVTKEQVEVACSSFCNKDNAKKYKTYTGITKFYLLKSKFLEWIPKSIKYVSNATKSKGFDTKGNENQLFISNEAQTSRNDFLK